MHGLFHHDHDAQTEDDVCAPSGEELRNQQEKAVYHVSLVNLFSNIGLSVIKMAAGVLGHSAAMISDAFHSLSDVAGTLIVMAGARISNRAADRHHPYGHERFECVASIVLGNILLIVGLSIGKAGVRSILHPEKIAVPTMLPVIVAVVSIIVKEILYFYTMRASRRLKSVSIKAQAWDHRSDSLASAGGLVGIVGARLGIPVLDPVASIVIGALIVKAAVDVFRETVNQLVDRACPDDLVEQMYAEVESVPGVMHVDDLRSRQFGAKMYVDVDITMDGHLTLYEAHKTARQVHDLLETGHPELKHCMVHVNPDEERDHGHKDL